MTSNNSQKLSTTERVVKNRTAEIDASQMIQRRYSNAWPGGGIEARITADNQGSDRSFPQRRSSRGRVDDEDRSEITKPRDILRNRSILEDSRCPGPVSFDLPIDSRPRADFDRRLDLRSLAGAIRRTVSDLSAIFCSDLSEEFSRSIASILGKANV